MQHAVTVASIYRLTGLSDSLLQKSTTFYRAFWQNRPGNLRNLLLGRITDLVEVVTKTKVEVSLESEGVRECVGMKSHVK